MQRLRLRESRGQTLGQRLQPGRAAGEIDRVDAIGREAGTPHRLAGSLDDAADVLLERLARLLRRHLDRQTALDPGQVDARGLAGSGVDLGALGTAEQVVAELVAHHLHQPGMLDRIGIVAAHHAQLLQARRAVDGVDQMPGGQIEIDPAGHLARRLAADRGPERAEAQRRHDRRQLDAAVEVGAGHMQAVVGQHIVGAVDAVAPLRADAHDREVGGAAADVGDQHALLGIDARFMVEGRRQRLELEGDLLEAGLARGLLERGLGLRVALRVLVDKMHRPADDRAARRHAGVLLGGAAQVAQIARDHLGEADRTAGADVGLLRHQPGAQRALHRAHQPALAALDIGRQRSAAMQPRQILQARALGQVEGGGRHRDRTVLQRHQPHRAAGVRHRDGGIGGAEIDGAEIGNRGGSHGRQADGRKGRDDTGHRPDADLPTFPPAPETLRPASAPPSPPPRAIRRTRVTARHSGLPAYPVPDRRRSRPAP